MTMIETALEGALHPAVKRKANRTRNLRASASRVAGGAPEVMVKITGFGKGAAHVKAHLEYISRNGKLELENEKGIVLSGKEDIKEYFSDWESDFSDSKRRANQRDTMHMVLSMPERTDETAVRNAVRNFARENFGANHEYVFALHTDEPHPHCHLTVKMKGFDGKRLNPHKADLQHWRESFAERLREQGEDAEATARRSRGVDRKAESSIVRHIDAPNGDLTHAPRVSKVKALKIREAVQEIIAEDNGVTLPRKPWMEKIADRKAKVRSSWLAAADALDNQSTSTKLADRKFNERPNYDRAGSHASRAVQRQAALYQSRLEQDEAGTATLSLASVRNLSRVRLVQHQRASEMLLQPNASDRLGWQRDPNHGVRRPGVSDLGLGGATAPGVEGHQSLAERNKALAARIRGVAERLHGTVTERDQMRLDLVEIGRVQQPDKAQSLAKSAPQIPQPAAEPARPSKPAQYNRPDRSNDLDR